MNYSKLYILFSISIGLLQVFDGLLLIRTARRVTQPNFVISALELGWAAVSCFALLKFESVPAFLPLSFLVFTIGGAIYSAILFGRLDPKERETLATGLVMPRWVIFSSVLFGIFFAGSSYLVYRQQYW